ncbi:MAG: M20 family peptidase [Candidatus Abyssobacteria bacterium SURF_17]|jgi:succinyl-diaminopimelate desuccinylase|uniref:M20 family peptidase n=1 Tax=Candidatus Abyssobacteria bacterium SURF_17 TaxID=2093361 RepID=A0A419ETM2_9BACT|nr:MAG: M20 family peptidase [Candidatus Abyssubacteria bacterium SURF_17]
MKGNVMDYKRAFECVEANRDYIVETLRKIVRIDTSVPPGRNYGKLVAALEPDFHEFGFTTERVIIPEQKVKEIPYELEGERVNLVARKIAGKEPVSLYAHMDVVPIEEGWKCDPFAGILEGDTFYGRGASDMKGSIACLMGALKVMHTLSLEPRFDMHCLLCTDEEIGVYPGVYHLALNGYVHGHMLNLELGAQEPIILQACEGGIDVVIIGVGKSCHSGMNFMGVNALEEMVPIMNELLVLKREVEKRESKVPSFPLPDVPSTQLTPMFNLSVIQSGAKPNITPGECKLILNRRYIPEEDEKQVVREIEEAIARGRSKSKLIDLKVQFIHDYPPVVFDIESPHMKKMNDARRAVHGYEDFLVGGIGGSTDMGCVAKALKTDKFIGVSPTRASNVSAHAANERVEVADLISMTKELVHYLAF